MAVRQREHQHEFYLSLGSAQHRPMVMRPKGPRMGASQEQSPLPLTVLEDLG